MAINNPSMGEGYTPAYQISAIPFVTSSTVALGQIKSIQFGYVTRFITIKNTGAAGSVLAFGFTENGMRPENSNCYFLSGSESFTGELRTTQLYVSGAAGSSTYSLVAGLTYINARDFVPITGSNGYSGVG